VRGPLPFHPEHDLLLRVRLGGRVEHLGDREAARGGTDPTNPPKLPGSTIKAVGQNIVEEFLGKGSLTPSATPGRRWGPASAKAPPAAETWFNMPGGPRQGLLGLAILRSAGIPVAGLTESQLQKESVDLASAADRVALQTRNAALADAILGVDKRLGSMKAG
jgi:hypothetical protein